MNDMRTLAELCDEVAKLEWINRALKQQIKFNEQRMNYISGLILEMKKEVDCPLIEVEE